VADMPARYDTAEDGVSAACHPGMNSGASIQERKRARIRELEQQLDEVPGLLEDEVLSILDNPYATPRLLAKIAQTARLTAFYSVRLKLVAHRQTPQAHAVKFVHYLYWFDLVALAMNVQVPAPVRRAIETLLVSRAERLSLGERIASARRCTTALIKVFLFDAHPRVFEALLSNKRLREDDLLALVATDRATSEQLQMIAADRKWSYRYAIRKALVLNPSTPRAAAASQLRFLSRRDRAQIHANPATSVYLRRCIERME
jgi:hypothetical protein